MAVLEGVRLFFYFVIFGFFGITLIYVVARVASMGWHKSKLEHLERMLNKKGEN